jgi:hypothetical protein
MFRKKRVAQPDQGEYEATGVLYDLFRCLLKFPALLTLPFGEQEEQSSENKQKQKSTSLSSEDVKMDLLVSRVGAKDFPWEVMKLSYEQRMLH